MMSNKILCIFPHQLKVVYSYAVYIAKCDRCYKRFICKQDWTGNYFWEEMEND